MYFWKVVVEDPKTGEAVDFPCRRWFSKSEDDGKISRELSRGDATEDEIIVDKGNRNFLLLNSDWLFLLFEKQRMRIYDDCFHE